jgi:hypothetical protein
MTAAGFAFFAVVLAGIPPLAFAVFFASPFTSVWVLVAGPQAPWPLPQAFLALLFIASFPVAGLLIGYAFPFQGESFKQIWNGVGMRLAIYLVVMGIVGPLLLLL